MTAAFTLQGILAAARRSKKRIVATVIFADDRVLMVEAGPRGGWKIL